ncbi:MAG: GTPase HflX [Cyanobacteriota bacterium]|nr:GTPase HflX [Cyanobacteriota bacterium]
MLLGRTEGLRPSVRHRLERLLHRRHPADAVADPLTLQRLGLEGAALEMPLTLMVDDRGLPRALWVGDLESSRQIQERLSGDSRRQVRVGRLLTCAGSARQPALQPGHREGLVALDLAVRCWLRFGPMPAGGGRQRARLWVPSPAAEQAWSALREGDLVELCRLDPPARDEGPSRGGGAGPTAAPASDGPLDSRERVLLLVLSQDEIPLALERRIAELEGLVRSAGAVPVGVVLQRRSGAAGAALWGEGKVREAALEARRLHASLVVSDRELTPGHIRQLERSLALPVSDRSELILDIFAQRAASSAGRLQVELAQLRYRLPRLTGRGVALSRQGGGIGTRGPGETQLEKDRRAIARRIDRLQREVARLGAHRARLRQSRRETCRLALVGYTNAGKSSLLNALSGAAPGEGVLAENKLFATLDPTTRRLRHDSADRGRQEPILLTDTVGFIRDLPPALVEAFRSTFEEALDADGLLLVVDLADPSWPEQLAAVRSVLNDFHADRPRRVIGNQIDRCPAGELDRARALEPDMLFVSATADLGLRHLRQVLNAWAADLFAVTGSSVVNLPLPDVPAARRHRS